MAQVGPWQLRLAPHLAMPMPWHTTPLAGALYFMVGSSVQVRITPVTRGNGTAWLGGSGPQRPTLRTATGMPWTLMPLGGEWCCLAEYQVRPAVIHGNWSATRGFSVP